MYYPSLLALNQVKPCLHSCAFDFDRRVPHHKFHGVLSNGCVCRVPVKCLLSAHWVSAECPHSPNTRWALGGHSGGTLDGQHSMYTRRALGGIGGVIVCSGLKEGRILFLSALLLLSKGNVILNVLSYMPYMCMHYMRMRFQRYL